MVMMNFKSLIKPKKIDTVGQLVGHYGKFVAEPYEKGFGITIGNALRRVMLSSIEGTAVVGIRIEGISNEFSTISGVKEDIVEILLNIKSLELNSTSHEQIRASIKKKGAGPIVAGDIEGDINLEILEPEQHILTVTDDSTEIYIELFIERGIGYLPSEEFGNKFDDIVGVIPIDAVFTPIKSVNYYIENARVGQSTDYEKLTMEIETDGSIKPENAMAFAAKIIKDYMMQYINFEETIEVAPEVETSKSNDQIVDMLDNSIEELELSVRAYNCLKNANIETLYELCTKTDGEMLKTKNFGRKSLEEIKKVLCDLGLSLGMDLSAYGYETPVISDEDDEEED